MRQKLVYLAGLGASMLLGLLITRAILAVLITLYQDYIERVDSQKLNEILASEVVFLYKNIDWDYPTVRGYRIRIERSRLDSFLVTINEFRRQHHEAYYPKPLREAARWFCLDLSDTTRYESRDQGRCIPTRGTNPR